MKTFVAILLMSYFAYGNHICQLDAQASLDLNQETVLKDQIHQSAQSVAIHDYFRFLNMDILAEIKPKEVSIQLKSVMPSAPLKLSIQKTIQKSLQPSTNNSRVYAGNSKNDLRVFRNYYSGGAYYAYSNTWVQSAEIKVADGQTILIITQTGPVLSSTGGFNVNGAYKSDTSFPLLWHSLFKCQKIQ